MELVDCTPTGLTDGLPREVADGAKTHEQKLRRSAIRMFLSAAVNTVAIRLYSGEGDCSLLDNFMSAWHELRSLSWEGASGDKMPL